MPIELGNLRWVRAPTRVSKILLIAFSLVVTVGFVFLLIDLDPADVTARRGHQDSTRTGSVRGRVLDRRSRPISGATLEFSSAPRRLVSSAEDGHFTSGPLPSGPCAVRLRAPGFALASPRGVDVPTGREVEMTLVLADAARLSGVVSDPHGRAIPNARIGLQGEDRAREIGPSGRFEFDDVRAGTARITVEAPGFQAWSKQDLVLPAVDLSISLHSRWTIEGVVVDPATGAPIEIEHLIVESCGQWSLPWMKTGERRFEFSSSSVAWLSQRSITGSFPNVSIGPDLEPIDCALHERFERLPASERGVILEGGERFRVHGNQPCLALVIVQAADGARCVGGPYLCGSESGDPSVRIEFRGGTTLRVRGIDAVSKLPIAGATVWHGALIPETTSRALDRMVSTDSDGSAVLREIHGSWTFVRVTHPEYEGQVVRFDRSVANPTLEFALKPVAPDDQGDAKR